MLKHLGLAAAICGTALATRPAEAAGCEDFLIICDDQECEVCALDDTTDDFVNCHMMLKLEVDLTCGTEFLHTGLQLTAPLRTEITRPDLRIIVPPQLPTTSTRQAESIHQTR